jgi:O-antigen ligase
MFRRFLYALWILAVITNFGAIATLSPTGLAAQAMTAMLGCVFFICRYFLFREWRDLGMYAFMATMPIFAITRMVIANTLMLPVLMLVPISLVKRLTFLGVSIMAGTFVFFLPQVQKKMFVSGQGELADVNIDNKELSTSGRSYIWENLLDFANQKPWFGHGTGQGETYTYSITPVGYPHNDWLLTFTDYGWFGVGVYLICNLWMMWDCWQHGHKTKKPTLKLFFFAGASSFIPYMMVMFTDNIMVYAPFFGILQYTIIGLAYGALNTRKKRPKRKRNQIKSTGGTPDLIAAMGKLPG